VNDYQIISNRFAERRPPWRRNRDELPVVTVTDQITGESEEFVDDYGGGKQAERWKFERLWASEMLRAAEVERE